VVQGVGNTLELRWERARCTSLRVYAIASRLRAPGAPDGSGRARSESARNEYAYQEPRQVAAGQITGGSRGGVCFTTLALSHPTIQASQRAQ
jgi:hypothetical protein